MRSPNRTHNRESFFKYMPAPTAKLVLANRTLRWSSPLLFNDPFDIPRELSFGVTPDEIVQALSKRMVALIEAPPEDTSMLEPNLRIIIEAAKNTNSNTLKQELYAGIKSTAATLKPGRAGLDALRDLWRSWIPEFRILCLTESPAHAAMWYHYADSYKGVVIELKCLDAHDSAWLGAMPVTYPKEKPAVYTAEGLAEILTLRHELAVQKIRISGTYTKSPDWSYESEWRVASYKRTGETGLFSDYKFHPLEVGAIYLGPQTPQEVRVEISSLAKAYPQARVLSTSIGMSREFIFGELHT
jgi:hypothetical protein